MASPNGSLGNGVWGRMFTGWHWRCTLVPFRITEITDQPTLVPIKPGINMACPNPCKETNGRPHPFLVRTAPYSLQFPRALPGAAFVALLQFPATRKTDAPPPCLACGYLGIMSFQPGNLFFPLHIYLGFGIKQTASGGSKESGPSLPQSLNMERWCWQVLFVFVLLVRAQIVYLFF